MTSAGPKHPPKVLLPNTIILHVGLRRHTFIHEEQECPMVLDEASVIYGAMV